MIEWKITIDADSMVDFLWNHPEMGDAIRAILDCEAVKHHDWESVVWYHDDTKKVQTNTLYGVMGGVNNAK